MIGRSQRHTWVARLLAVAIAAVLASSTLFAGATYLWCTAMQQAMASCCCPQPEREQVGQGAPSIERGSCCEERSSTAAPASATLSVEKFAAAAPTAVALPEVSQGAPPAVAERHADIAVPPPHTAIVPRAGPPTAAERCAVLRVFHC